MKISLITPAPHASRAGNRQTAVRWARILKALGHRVSLAQVYEGEPADLMIALHAYRSAASIQYLRQHRPATPVIVALTGTDIYHFIHTDPVTLQSMELADRLVGLHALVCEAIPPRLCGKLHVIYQSARPLPPGRPARRDPLRVCVIGHLRDEKDPLRAALAARALPAASRIRVLHLGRALEPAWAERAQAEMAQNSRYLWIGEVPQARVRDVLGRSWLMVLSSTMEGGANVLSEAVVAGVPVIASRIPGNMGLLGLDYAGYFPVGDTEALTALLARAEQEPQLHARLAEQCALRAPLFHPEREHASWAALLAEVVAVR
jgi:putative glycosyltransferase (TIGR04348 family)